MFSSRILVLAPHPDDEIVGCCAAIGRARSQGAVVRVAFLTTGVPAREVFWPWERWNYEARVLRRWDEARRAAERLGVEAIHFSEIPSRCLQQDLEETRARIGALAREHAPDSLWTPAYEGGHTDHDVTNFLASAFRKALTVWEFSEYNFRGGQVRSNEFISMPGQEQQILLTDEERRFKRGMVAHYASERGNLRHIRDEREVFRPLAAYDYSRPPHAGKLFYQRFQWVPFHPRVDYTRPQSLCHAFTRFKAPA